jgi:type I restriction enzyme S subunit
MNAERLLQYFDRISEAPNAIPRLRRFILDLAVRGKLVAQDPNDEPAGELLKRIQVEKERLVRGEGQEGTYLFRRRECAFFIAHVLDFGTIY